MEENKIERNFQCMFCKKYFTRNYNLQRHFLLVHNVCIVKAGQILKEFNSFSEFKNWKENEEIRTKSSYVRQRGNNKRKNGAIVMYYHCCRSGVYKPKGRGLRTLKSQGSVKIGTTCPARMKVDLIDGKVIVNYFPKHENHELHLGNIKLPRSHMTSKSIIPDVVESYKHLVKEKEVLETSIKSLTYVEKNNTEDKDETSTSAVNDNSDSVLPEKISDDSLQKLKSSLGALTVEKARVENELRADRKKLLLEKEELERTLSENENKWSLEKEKYESLIQELKKKVSNQQREREKEQQDHALMLKELQNLLAVERANKEKCEEQVNELQQKLNSKLTEKKALDYEKHIELQNKLKAVHNKWQAAERQSNNHLILLKNVQEEMDDMKLRFKNKLEEEAKRADGTEEKLKLLTLVKEKRIANLEARISDLSDIIGNYDKTNQQNLLTIQKLKEKINQLQVEHSTLDKVNPDNKFWDYKQSNINDESIQKHHMKSISQLTESDSGNMLNFDENHEISSIENVHVHCQAEILQLKEELEMIKSKAEAAMKENHSKPSHTLLSAAKTDKDIKELKGQVSQLQKLLHSSKSQIKLNEEYHNKITTNLENSIQELKTSHKQEIAQIKISHQAKLMELEHQIQKQRERTLSLLEEKDKEIGLLKTTFLSSVIKKDKLPNDSSPENSNNTSDHEAAAMLLSNSLISSQKDGHILHYVQELARKDIEISNLRQSRIQTESALRKLQQASLLTDEKHNQEIESLKSKVKLLESSKDQDGTNVEYLKNVVLRFLKCKDPSSQIHMVNAIATVLHFTNSEVHEVKSYLKT